ncbi:MAG: tRNA uridine-5-carboxymethylaminomethyl(34) synthesis enzyme MnmG [Bacteroidaceae bacterium]|nr:tRNA uridine-5-carboxymethylaminomethyl(34) synthesis enzyme MnmG [Bacteroidaceae bacterium]
MIFNYDVIVVGAGHAGCEAAAAAANLGAKTCLITMDMNKIAQMSCNPAIGGIAKGQIVREIDALGGQTGIVTDRCSLQFRMLNLSKGPAVWSPRAQCDRGKFIWTWREILENTPNLNIWQDQVKELIIENQEVQGLITYYGAEFRAKCVIITAGTFLNGLMHIGRVKLAGGRCSEPASLELTESITKHGIRSGRMKTGTPVRIDKRSVDFSLMEKQEGDHSFHKFSYMPSEHSAVSEEARNNLPCWICYTNKDVHDILRSGFADSPLYNGQIQSIGPRYCPSIETKLHTFPDKEEHMLFLEPEGETTNEMYLNGFSSSLPLDTQLNALRKIPAFRNLQVYRPGYAIEYDFFDPTQLTHSLESKIVKNLFFAGQVNGTTGYEEAAGQGLIAGINAAINCNASLNNGEPFILKRNEAYIGVLIDDLVTKGVDEPYRMFTSRAEYRILLRQDDADMRLTERSFKLGLASKERYEMMLSKQEKINAIIDFASNFSIKASIINPALEALGTSPLRQGCKLDELLERPQINIKNILPHIDTFRKEVNKILEKEERSEEILECAEIKIKYRGYILREQQMAEKMIRLENIKIKGKFDYPNLTQISIEARQKLQAIQPITLAQASRIPGVSPSDINIMLVLMGR